jgi:hypothetical protein
MPPAVSGQGGHDQTMHAARVVVYGFDLGPEAGFGLLWEHYNPRCEPPWSEAELRHKCQEADAKPFDRPRGWLLQTPGEFSLGPLVLRPGRPRQTPAGKLVLAVRVHRDGRPLDQVDLASSTGGRKAAADRLAQLAPGVTAEQVRDAIDSLIVWGLEQLDRQQAAGRDGDTVRGILAAYLRAELRPTYRVGRKIHLDRFGDLFDRNAFLHLLDNDLVDACTKAADADDDRLTLAARVEAEMRLLFGEILRVLPDRRTQDVPRGTVEQIKLSGCVIEMWSAVVALTRTKNRATGDEVTRNTSLIEQVKETVRGGKIEPGKWHQVHPGHSAFYRLDVVPKQGGAEGEVEERMLLAFNAELASSTRVKLPEGVNNFNLKKLGKKLGIVRDHEITTGRTSGGSQRLIVLSEQMTRHLLSDPTRDTSVTDSAEEVSPAEELSPAAGEDECDPDTPGDSFGG